MQVSKSIFSAGLLIVALYAGSVWAQNPAVKKTAPLAVTLTAQKVVKQGEKESFGSAEKIKPGDVVEYKVQYANLGNSVVSRVMATLPVPKGMQYIKDSAKPQSASATVDGKLYESVPLKRKVKDAAGNETEELVPEADYKALSWALGDIPAGKTVVVSARMQVSK